MMGRNVWKACVEMMPGKAPRMNRSGAVLVQITHYPQWIVRDPVIAAFTRTVRDGTKALFVPDAERYMNIIDLPLL